jgi:hypothetical protein
VETALTGRSERPANDLPTVNDRSWRYRDLRTNGPVVCFQPLCRQAVPDAEVVLRQTIASVIR